MTNVPDTFPAVGGGPGTDPSEVIIGRVLTFLYFVFFITMPLWTKLDQAAASGKPDELAKALQIPLEEVDRLLEAEGDALLSLVTLGALQAAIFRSDDLDTTFEEVRASGAEELGQRDVEALGHLAVEDRPRPFPREGIDRLDPERLERGIRELLGDDDRALGLGVDLGQQAAEHNLLLGSEAGGAVGDSRGIVTHAAASSALPAASNFAKSSGVHQFLRLPLASNWLPSSSKACVSSWPMVPPVLP